MATSSKKKTFVNKDDLKRLMKEKKSDNNSKKKKIDSPLAKYDSLGQLHCALCGCRVKNDLLWNAHISSRTHKENAVHFKDQQARKAEERLHPPSAVSNDDRKRKLQTKTAESGCKLQKVHPSKDGSRTTPLPSDFFDKGTTSASGGGMLTNIGGYGDSEGSDDDEAGTSSNPSKLTADQQVTGLPSDFFNTGVPPSAPAAVPKAESTQEPSGSRSMAEKLPEGFFDDAKLDAKARQVEYKDKMEEEWEMFHRAMKEETQVSEALQEEDNESVQVERNIKEIDEQLYHWSKVEELHQKKEQVMTSQKKLAQESGGSDSDADAQQEFEEFLDWRSKKVN